MASQDISNLSQMQPDHQASAFAAKSTFAEEPEQPCEPGVYGKGGIVLIPKPSNDPKDPLNWPPRKKYLTLFVLCFAAFAGAATPTAHQTGYVVISYTYHKTPTELSYSISAAVAGLLAGPLILLPFARVIGSTSSIFWSLLGAVATQIWAARMTGPNGYNSFVASRLFAGLFGSLATILGSGYIMDMFFLHQRGKAFACYELSLLLGVIASPTIGGFILNSNPWPDIFWWTLAPLGVALVLVFCFIEETGFARRKDQTRYPQVPVPFLANRARTFCPGTSVVPKIGTVALLKVAALPLAIGVAPATILAGSYTLITFAWSILISTELTIFLQIPVKEGGYGFTPLQNAAFTFTIWFALFAAQVPGALFNDRLPLWASRRIGHKKWRPEFRLVSMFLPATVSPIGLGIFGAGLQYHLHYMVLALGTFLVNFSALLCVPVCINYIVECFVRNPVEVSVVMNVYRLALGLALPFFFENWVEAVGIGWVFGMAAFFSLFAMLLMFVLAWKGHALRRFAFLRGMFETEEGENIVV